MGKYMERKIKVLHISKYYPPYIGGIESVAYDIVSSLQKSGNYEQKVICFNSEKNDCFGIYDSVFVYRIGSKAKISSQPINFGYKKQLRKVIDEFKPDVIHFHYPNPYVAHYLLKLNYHGKLIVHWHADIIKQKFLKVFFHYQNIKLLNRADLILATSPAYLKNTDYLPDYVDKIKILPLSIGESRTKITQKQIENAKIIKGKCLGKKICFFFGRHVAYKGLDYLIDSNQYLDQNKIEIFIGGQGPLTKKLKKKSEKYNNIHFLGRLSEDDINSYLLASDIFLFPSITRNEAFGISLAEAMYFGKPSCTFTIPGSGVNWVSLNDVTGLEAPNKDIKSYADNITKLVEDPILYKRLSENAKQRSMDYFTLECFEQKVVDVYNRLNGFIQ